MGLYNILFYGGLALAIVFLIVSVVLFFALKIPKVFGDLSGRTEKKSIEEIRKSGYESKSKQEAIHDKTSRITVRDANDPETSNLKKKNSDKKNLEKKAAADAKAAAKNKNKNNMDVMFGNETEVLVPDEGRRKEYDDSTEILGTDDDSTDLLTNAGNTRIDEESTDVLTSGNADEASTDVLTSKSDDEDGATDVLTSESDDEDGATDVLTSEIDDEDGATDVLTSESDDEDGATDVLTSKDTKEELDIIGHYSAEETAVLRSIHEPTTTVKTSQNKNITIIYTVTLVNTDETLQNEVK